MVEIRDSFANKGLFAKQYIEKGVEILFEKPLICVKRPLGVQDDLLYRSLDTLYQDFKRQVCKQYDRLTDSEKENYNKLFNAYKRNKDSALFEIFRSNCFLTPDGFNIITYFISKLNHTCQRPNVYVQISSQGLTLISIANISQNSELLIDYSPSSFFHLLTPEIRKLKLKHKFNFHCKCKVCCKPQTFSFLAELERFFELKTILQNENDLLQVRLLAIKESIELLYCLYSKIEKIKAIKAFTAFNVVTAIFEMSLYGLILGKMQKKIQRVGCGTFLQFFNEKCEKSLVNVQKFETHLGKLFVNSTVNSWKTEMKILKK